MNQNQHHGQNPGQPHHALHAVNNYAADMNGMQGSGRMGYGNQAPLRTTASGSTGATSSVGNK